MEWYYYEESMEYHAFHSCTLPCHCTLIYIWSVMNVVVIDSERVWEIQNLKWYVLHGPRHRRLKKGTRGSNFEMVCASWAGYFALHGHGIPDTWEDQLASKPHFLLWMGLAKAEILFSTPSCSTLVDLELPAFHILIYMSNSEHSWLPMVLVLS